MHTVFVKVPVHANWRVKACGNELWKDAREDTHFHAGDSVAEPGASPAVLSMLVSDDLIYL